MHAREVSTRIHTQKANHAQAGSGGHVRTRMLQLEVQLETKERARRGGALTRADNGALRCRSDSRGPCPSTSPRSEPVCFSLWLACVLRSRVSATRMRTMQEGKLLCLTCANCRGVHATATLQVE
eukprot:2932187-Rhodomonas_salina.1